MVGVKQGHNNAINSDSVKRHEKHAPLYTACYGERWAFHFRSVT